MQNPAGGLAQIYEAGGFTISVGFSAAELVAEVDLDLEALTLSV